jgi:hypothetical protein
MLPECFHRGQEIEPGRWKCGHPGLMSPGVTEADCVQCHGLNRYCNLPPAPHHLRSKPAQSPPQNLDCKYRGAEIDVIPCETCAGNVRVKLFKCELYKFCILKPANITVNHEPPKACSNCNSREV